MASLGKTAKNIAMADSRIRPLANSLTLGSLVLAFGSLMLACTAALADDPPVTTQIVDLANKLNGVHPGFRAFHAKGVVVDGSFKASPEAARFSRATLFNGTSFQLPCASLMAMGCRMWRTARQPQTPMAWPSSTTCRAARTPTW